MECLFVFFNYPHSLPFSFLYFFQILELSPLKLDVLLQEPILGIKAVLSIPPSSIFPSFVPLISPLHEMEQPFGSPSFILLLIFFFSSFSSHFAWL
jgi:hypothetical protein